MTNTINHILSDPVAQDLLTSRIPARLAYCWKDGTPRVVPIKADKQYRSWRTIEHPQVNAAVIYMMDVSGSMTDEQKEIVRIESFWIDTWIKAHYKGVDRIYIIHA